MALKSNTAYGFIHRVLSLSDACYRKANIRIIFERLALNGYPRSFIKRLIGKFDDTCNYLKIEEVENGVVPPAIAKPILFYRSMVYIKGLTEKISRIITKENEKLGIGYRSVPTFLKIVL